MEFMEFLLLFIFSPAKLDAASLPPKTGEAIVSIVRSFGTSARSHFSDLCSGRHRWEGLAPRR